MSRTTQTRLARRLQVVAEDEIGKRPAYTCCLNIVRNSALIAGMNREEQAVRLYYDNKSILELSAAAKESQ